MPFWGGLSSALETTLRVGVYRAHVDSRTAGRDARLARAVVARRVVDALDDDALAQLMAGATSGWGLSSRVEVEGCRLFIKAVPVTQRELDSELTTTNLYGIPPAFNYPFGSPGLSVGRELAFARSSTEWVDTGECSSFPILIHDRIIQRPQPTRSSAGDYSAYGDDVASLSEYLHDRAAATSALVLAYEDLADNAADRIITSPSDVGWIVDDVEQAIAFLQSCDIVHFDIDLFNVVTDGERAYIADHGLVMDPTFDLNPDERQFLARNRHFDQGNLYLAVGHQVYEMYRAQPDDARRRIDLELGLTGCSFETAALRLIDAVDQLDERGLLHTGATLRALIAEHHAAIHFMHDFFTSARADWSTHTLLDDLRLAELLDA
jgi:hypothetical protein